MLVTAIGTFRDLQGNQLGSGIVIDVTRRRGGFLIEDDVHIVDDGSWQSRGFHARDLQPVGFVSNTRSVGLVFAKEERD